MTSRQKGGHPRAMLKESKEKARLLFQAGNGSQKGLSGHGGEESGDER